MRAHGDTQARRTEVEAAPQQSKERLAWLLRGYQQLGAQLALHVEIVTYQGCWKARRVRGGPGGERMGKCPSVVTL